MPKKPALAILSVCILVGLGPVGCGHKKSPGNPGNDATGTVTFMLSATGASGKTYRLRSATFSVAGPESKSVTSPTDPNDAAMTVTASLLPGAYMITLADGWKMFRVPTTGAPVEVPATLISPKTVSFTIAPSMDTKVAYQFDVLGEIPVPGTVTIGVGVNEVDGGSAGTTGAAGTSGAAGTTSAAGTTGAAGTTAQCGNGVVQAGEQCDSATTFANHTCDFTTCQSIPIVCGNHLLQPGEQCDDGPTGSVNCTTACTIPGAAGAAGTTGAAGTSGAAGTTGAAGTSGAAGTTGAAGTAGACSTCETEGTVSMVCSGTRVVKNVSPVGCAGFTTADDQTKCTTLLHCLQTHPNCSITTANPTLNTDPTGCFCGDLNASACSGTAAASIPGACASAYFAVYGGTTNANRDQIISDFFNRTLPVGMANNLYSCDVNNHCQSVCP